MRKLIFILLIIGIAFSVVGQSQIDSLSKSLNKPSTNEEKIAIIYNNISQIGNQDLDTAIYFSNIGIGLCHEVGDIKTEAKFKSIIGSCHSRLSNYSEALGYLFEACKLNIEENDSSLNMSIYNTIGNVYRQSNQLNEAKDFYARSLDIARLINDSSWVAIGFNNLGIIYMMNGEYPMGMSLWANSLSIKLAIGDSLAASSTMGNMAMYYRDIGQTKKALDLLLRAVKIETQYNDYEGTTIVYDNLGELYMKQKDYVNMLKYYDKSLEQAQLSNSKRAISNAYSNLSKAYKVKGSYKKALEYFELYTALEDSIMSQKTMNDLSIAESKYENVRKAHVIEKMLINEEVQSAQIKKQEEEAKRQQLIKISFAIGAFIMLLFGLVMFRNYKRKREDHQLISEQKEEVEQQHKEITDSINYAKRIQTAILPPKALIKEHLKNSFILYKPKDIVAGDFYWLEVINDAVIFAAADCTGHGVPGAMISVVCNNALNRAVREFKLIEPAAILDKVTDLVIEQFEKSEEDVKDGMDIALCFLKENMLYYSGANNPLWIIRDKKIIEIKATKQPVGKYALRKPFDNHSIELKKGDVVYVFTDGYVDQFGGPKGKKLKSKGFKELLLSIVNEPMKKQKKLIDGAFENWKGDLEQVDDVCVIGVKV